MRFLGGNKSSRGDSSTSTPSSSSSTTPICRCRVLYLGSAVPHVTKDGLQGIQQPLRELYPSEGIASAKGIDSWLSVWSNGLLLENVDEKQKRITRFFPIESLHYCAAVRYVIVPDSGSATAASPTTNGDQTQQKAARFLPLDSPFARNPSVQHPPLFAAILRRTTGIKVLECHVFICKREQPTNALVRCCFHAYGDSMHARQMGGELYQSIYGNLKSNGRASSAVTDQREQDEEQAQIDVIERVEDWHVEPSTSGTSESPSTSGGGGGGCEGTGSGSGGRDGSDTELVLLSDNINHKVWNSLPLSADENDISPSDQSTMYGGRDSAVYGTGGRSNRPRQRVMPAAPTPPPLPPPPQQPQSQVDGGRKVRKLRKRSERDSSSSPSRTMQRGLHMSSSPNHTSPMHFNGHGNGHINGHTHNNGYTNGHMHNNGYTNGHIHNNGHTNGHIYSNGHANGNSSYMNGYGSLSRPSNKSMNGMRNERAGSQNRIARAMSTRPQAPVSMFPPQIVYGTLPPPPHMQMVPLPPMMPGYGPAMMTLPHPMRLRGAHEEPPCMPSMSRPMSPTASYQPSHFPHDAYQNYQRQYATMDGRRYRRSESGGVRSKNKSDSPPSLGIYKQRRNHLNEKAFGFSIQQEQRSRSIGSLVDSKSPADLSPIRQLENGMQDMHLRGGDRDAMTNARINDSFSNGTLSTFGRASRNDRQHQDHERPRNGFSS